MGKIFVDTSAWVALFIENDHLHSRALPIFEKIYRTKTMLYTSDYVIDETLTTILVKGDHSKSVLAGKALFESNIMDIIYVAPNHFEGTWELYQKYKDKKFSFTDVSSFFIMKQLGINQAFSFDAHFQQTGFEMLN
ncbi:MAG: type II toxin-antitoxin system VapC family toxin [Chlamydiae bacterium]|nr:type II toxin-antitoxin system VapC family toxin [Chlamydiota bacterium]MBI3277945.1 type II toxin-antitoxin system VapC family toxin [Chlamydiota bacterium]